MSGNAKTKKWGLRNLVKEKKKYETLLNSIDIEITDKKLIIAGRLSSNTQQIGEILINGRKETLAFGTSV